MTDRLDDIKRLLAEATPGRWVCGVVDGQPWVYAHDEKGCPRSLNRDADARLIAAAPELLAWCVETIEGLERGLADAVDGQVELEREAEQLRGLIAIKDAAIDAAVKDAAEQRAEVARLRADLEEVCRQRDEAMRTLTDTTELVVEARRLRKLFDACAQAECPTLGAAMCPHGDTMHFHHDECPSCWAAEQGGARP